MPANRKNVTVVTELGIRIRTIGAPRDRKKILCRENKLFTVRIDGPKANYTPPGSSTRRL
jgi:hypothetical protein